MGRYGDAAMTYNKLTKLVTQNAQLWADFADALAMASGQKLAGHPTLLIKTALALRSRIIPKHLPWLERRRWK